MSASWHKLRIALSKVDPEAARALRPPTLPERRVVEPAVDEVRERLREELEDLHADKDD